MQEIYGVYAVAAVLIGIMLMLCFDVVIKNREILNTFKSHETKVVPDTKHQASMPVYPLYIDCSSDLIHNREGYETADHPIEIKQGA
ncbi:hypothetical protein GCM10023310_27730 [Paenibacillus vulneris]|uniref:Transposase n=1 Tax=Paenibacillus vulneris TaxID=1133364 RepID=A0ABW3UQ59_9BACL|nr:MULTISPECIES: hypothetical protein [unclassified Paenibacillus]MBE1442196.1 hypothetical protein [Paenibacillus sp. OAS669]